MIDLDKKIWQWMILIGLAFIWGSSFILMKKGLQSYSNYQVAAFRIFISFVVLLPIIIKSLKKINRKNIFYLLIVGVIGNMIPAFLYTTAQTQINSSLAGMLNSLTPLFTLVIGIIIFRTKTGIWNIIGLIIGLVGAVGLAVKDFSTFFDGNNWYGLLAILATLCYGLNVNIVKEKLQGLSGVEITALAFIVIGPTTGIYLLFSDFGHVLETPNYRINLFYIFLLALFSSVFAVMIMNILIKHTTALFVSTVTYIIPIFAVLWGLFDNEIFNLIDILWGGVILVGVYLINKKTKNNKI